MEAQLKKMFEDMIDKCVNKKVARITNENKQLQKEVDELLKRIEILEKTVGSQAEKLDSVAIKRNEIFYQKYLEKHLGGCHKKNVYGVADLSDDYTIIEIKHWPDYKTALGQTYAYSHGTNKRRYVYFFGEASDGLRRMVIDLYKEHDISICEFVDVPTGIDIVTLLDTHEGEVTNTPFDWIRGRLRYSKDSQVCLGRLCHQFYNKREVTMIERQVFNEDVNRYISSTFTQSDVKRRGDWWHHIAYYDKDDSFIQWLENNVVYKKDSILKLEPMCKQALGNENMSSYEKSPYREKTELFIKLNFDQKLVKHEYGKVRLHGKTHSAWKNLGLKDIGKSEKLNFLSGWHLRANWSQWKHNYLANWIRYLVNY
jgi:hypothetical protein